MDRADWQLVLSALTAAGVPWNAIQIDGVDSKVDELRGKVDTIEAILEGHVNSPALHSDLPPPERELSAAR